VSRAGEVTETAGARRVGATYRVQFEPGVLEFDDAAERVGYLASLGVTHLYCSPVLQARRGSGHGYDVTDPTKVREELGGEAGLRRLADAAHAAGLGLVVDIVPNHVGVDADNPLWSGLLAEGGEGASGNFFDVDWSPALPGAQGKVVLPVLGAPYGDVLTAGELAVVDEGGLRVRYHEHTFPLRPESEAQVRQAGGPGAFMGEAGDRGSWQALHDLLESQHYRLVWWRPGGTLVNYRRFFAINDLAAVRVEDEDVFEHTHRKILELVAEGIIDGLRVDHPDGLRDPARYFERLAARTGGLWTVAEKITARGETLPDWPVAGTTGYDFAADVLGLFVDPDARTVLDDICLEFGGSGEPFPAVAVAAKQEALRTELPGDTDRLAMRLWSLTQTHPEVRDVTSVQCKEVVGRVAAALDVYRTYVDPETGKVAEPDRERIDAALARAQGRLPDGTEAGAPAFLYAFLGSVLRGEAESTAPYLDLAARFQQLSSALEAKGVEDTALYRYRRLLAVNEVGGDPEQLGLGVEAFHRRNLERARRHPTGMLTTATHDTKRGEDVRLRVAALSELGDRWAAAVKRWRDCNAEYVVGTRTGPAPDPSTELLIYQTLVGVWPLDGSDPDDTLIGRVADYVVKASREASLRTSHTDPDPEFENGLVAFVDAVMRRSRAAAFFDAAEEVFADAAEIAMTSGLAQALLRTTCPGVPDTYQGTECWDDSLVDPDNRRPVDFGARDAMLAQLDREPPADLLERRRDGRVKLWVLSRALRTRQRYPQSFGAGAGYVPLAVEGTWGEHVVAFCRTAPDGSRGPVTVTPRLPSRVADGGLPIGGAWGNTVVVVPDGLQGPWVDRLSGTRHEGDRLTVSDLLGALPVALLTPES
jgi:(1->4)-alpha-D-glucan 1-alpha-D-glucosylmutase